MNKLQSYVDYSSRILKDVFDYLGMKDLEVQVDMYSPKAYSFDRLRISFVKNVDLLKLHEVLTPEEFFERYLQSFISSVQNSRAIQDAKAELTKRVEFLEKEVERMKPFEEHFKVEMKLRHGEN